MHRTSRSLAVLAAVLMSGTSAWADSYGAPILDSKSPFSVSVEQAMTAILHPLDVALKPLDTLVRPITSGTNVSRSAPQPVAVEQSDPTALSADGKGAMKGDFAASTLSGTRSK